MMVSRWIGMLAACGVLLAVAPVPSARLVRLASRLPAPGTVVTVEDLGIGICLPSPLPDSYNICPPKDLDTRRTDRAPFKGQYPDLYLNMPLRVEPGIVNYLFMSDQPEEIRDDRRREDGSQGARGIYASNRFPGRAPVRVLMDHTNGTNRPLKLWLLWVPDRDGVLMVRKRGEAVHADSVAAAAQSFAAMAETPVEPRHALTGGVPFVVVEKPLPAGHTAVVEMEFVSTVPGRLASAVIEAEEPVPDLATLPVMHSIVWSEESDRLRKYVDPEAQPTRWQHIVSSTQHARGGFHFPDRMAELRYQVASWDEKAEPVRVYSLYESVPGVDPTAASAPTENRGKYGAIAGFNIQFSALPPGCHEVALLVLNADGTYGGRHTVTDWRHLGVETLFLPGSGHGLLQKHQAAILWRGDLAAGDTLTLWTEPMSNISVSLWYMVVPLP